MNDSNGWHNVKEVKAMILRDGDGYVYIPHYEALLRYGSDAKFIEIDTAEGEGKAIIEKYGL